MSFEPLHSLAFSPRASTASGQQPLPADEQLALLLHLIDSGGPEPLDSHGGISSTAISLDEAYQVCKRITRHHSKSFFFSTQFLPYPKRRAIWALYAFCRTSDDTVDMAPNNPARALATWVRHVRRPTPPPHDPVLLAWHDTRQIYHLSSHLIDELLAGVAMDLTIHHYADFADLWLYCYRVASVVGLLSMGIIGAGPGAESYAIKLGVALQLTNILRDVGEDAQRGRVYLPIEDLARFGLTVDDILAETYDERFRALMQFEIARTHRLYEESWPGIALLAPESRLAVGVAARVYRHILDKIVEHDYHVFHRRASLSGWEKAQLLPSIWNAVRRLNHKKPS